MNSETLTVEGLAEWITAQEKEHERRACEITIAYYAETSGVTFWKARGVLERLVTEGKMTKREGRGGNGRKTWFYRKAE